jgi:hypothetical protein
VIPRALLALCLAAAVTDAAALYKWVDEKGVTHYTETPPPDRKSTQVEIKPSSPASRADDTTEGWKEREQELRKKRLDKALAEETEKARIERTATNRRNRCLHAQRVLDVLQSRPIYHTNERGERVYMEDKERAKETEEWREVARQSCDTR